MTAAVPQMLAGGRLAGFARPHLDAAAEIAMQVRAGMQRGDLDRLFDGVRFENKNAPNGARSAPSVRRQVGLAPKRDSLRKLSCW